MAIQYRGVKRDRKNREVKITDLGRNTSDKRSS
jgi:hypothetical protein